MIKNSFRSIPEFTILTMLAAYIAAGPVPQYLFGHDIILVLNGAFKMAQGDSPSTDWFSPLGALVYWPTQVFFKLSDSLFTAFWLSTVAVSVITLLLFYLWKQKKENHFYQSFLIVFISSWLLASRLPGYSSEMLTNACYYNKMGLGLLVFLLFLLGQNTEPKENIKFLITIGIIICLLFFTKISYAVCGIFLVLCRFFSKKDFLCIVSFGVITTLSAFILSFLFHVNIYDYISDLHQVFLVKQASKQNVFSELYQRNNYESGVFLLLSAIFLWTTIDKSKISFSLAAIITPFLLIFGNATNFQLRGDFIEFAAFSTFFLPQILLKNSLRPSFKIMAILLTGILVIPSFLKNCNAIRFSLEQKNVEENGFFNFRGPLLAGLKIKGFGGDPPLSVVSYVSKIEDGKTLLEQNGNFVEPCLVFDFTDAVNLVRAVPPPVGAPTFWQYGFSFNEKNFPKGEKIFRSVNYVLIPKRFGDGNNYNILVFLNVYKPFIENKFFVAGESQEWVLLKRQ